MLDPVSPKASRICNDTRRGQCQAKQEYAKTTDDQSSRSLDEEDDTIERFVRI